MTNTSTAIGAVDLRDTLINIAREIEALKRECGMDPESPIAIQNGRYMALSYKVRALAAGQATAAQQGVAYAALPDAPLSVFSKGPWTFKETGQNFSGAELDEAAFVAYHDRASHGQAPAGAGESAYDPCGGCGEDDPKKRCLGCMHPFTPTPQAAPSVLEDAAQGYERRHAIRQGHEIATSDAYFEARPQIVSADRRKVFRAGFERGWDAALAAKKGGE